METNVSIYCSKLLGSIRAEVRVVGAQTRSKCQTSLSNKKKTVTFLIVRSCNN
jgi:hypothetical protein